MFSRKNEEQRGKDFPIEYLEEAKEILLKHYANECLSDEKGMDFFIHGQIHSDELLFIVSYLSKIDTQTIPVSFFFSYNLMSEKEIKRLLPKILEIAVNYLDTYFSNREDFEYTPYWLEEEVDNVEFFYKISRENIQLSLKAHELLS